MMHLFICVGFKAEEYVLSFFMHRCPHLFITFFGLVSKPTWEKRGTNVVVLVVDVSWVSWF